MIVDDARHSSMKVTKLSNQLSHGCPDTQTILGSTQNVLKPVIQPAMGCPKLSLQHPSPPNRTILLVYPVFIRLTGYPLGYYVFKTSISVNSCKIFFTSNYTINESE